MCMTCNWVYDPERDRCVSSCITLYAEMCIKSIENLQISLYELITEYEPDTLTLEEQNLLAAYRSADPGMRAAARKLLDAPELPGKSSTSENGREAI